MKIVLNTEYNDTTASQTCLQYLANVRADKCIATGTETHREEKENRPKAAPDNKPPQHQCVHSIIQIAEVWSTPFVQGKYITHMYTVQTWNISRTGPELHLFRLSLKQFTKPDNPRSSRRWGSSCITGPGGRVREWIHAVPFISFSATGVTADS